MAGISVHSGKPSGDIRRMSFGNDEHLLKSCKIDAWYNFGSLKEAVAFLFDFPDFADHQALWIPTS